MKILAVEFSSEQRSVAVVEGRTDASPVLLGEASETTPRTVGALRLVEQALHAASLEREDIDCIAVGLGPGSYAGIRAAISLAQGWQFARAVKLLGISSVECLAAQAQAASVLGRVNIAIDAQRHELYLAGYEISANACAIVEPLRIATLEEARTRLLPGQTFAGPEVNRWFDGGRVLLPSAAMLGQLAAARTGFVTGDKLEPIYLRETNFVKAPPPRIIP